MDTVPPCTVTWKVLVKHVSLLFLMLVASKQEGERLQRGRDPTSLVSGMCMCNYKPQNIGCQDVTWTCKDKRINASNAVQSKKKYTLKQIITGCELV